MYRIDGSGYVLYGVATEDESHFTGESDFVTGTITGLLKPKWDGTAFAEDATQTELNDDLQDYKDSHLALLSTDFNACIIAVHGGLAEYMMHAKKHIEAGAVKGSPYLPKYERNGAISNYPHIDKEVTRTGQTALQVADAILAAENGDVVKEADYDDFRLKAKTAINAATDKAGVDTAWSTWLTDKATV